MKIGYFFSDILIDKKGMVMSIVLVFMVVSHIFYVSVLQINQIQLSHLTLHKQYIQAQSLVYLARSFIDLSQQQEYFNTLTENKIEELQEKHRKLFNTYDLYQLNHSELQLIKENKLIQIQYFVYCPELVLESLSTSHLLLEEYSKRPVTEADFNIINLNTANLNSEYFKEVNVNYEVNDEVITWPIEFQRIHFSNGYVEILQQYNQYEYLVSLDEANQTFTFNDKIEDNSLMILSIIREYHIN